MILKQVKNKVFEINDRQVGCLLCSMRNFVGNVLIRITCAGCSGDACWRYS